MKKDIVDARAAGRVGGNKTKERYGVGHYKKIINKRWANQKKKKTMKKVLNIFGVEE